LLMRDRHATPYHAPLYLAQSKGYFKDEGVKVAILEPNDPSVSHFFGFRIFRVLTSCRMSLKSSAPAKLISASKP
jgi:hypothetical protein